MTIESPFLPNYGSGVTVAPGVVAASTTLANKTKSVVITNLSSSVVSYVRVSAAGTAATTADFPVLPSSKVVLGKADDDLIVSYITSSGTGSIHIMAGEGY